jgi:vacuolar iron transporter family protein
VAHVAGRRPRVERQTFPDGRGIFLTPNPAVDGSLAGLTMTHRVPSTAAPPRDSIHIEPRGLRATAQHYLKDVVYGANDGLITTFAVVAGVEGGALTRHAVLVVGLANLLADGLSMGVGNYLSIRSQESVRRTLALPEEEARPERHGIATFLAFVAAGALPLIPYVLRAWPASSRLASATVSTFVALFAIGALRSVVTDERPIAGGLEMLGLGVAVAAVAYYAGTVAASLLA